MRKRKRNMTRSEWLLVGVISLGMPGPMMMLSSGLLGVCTGEIRGIPGLGIDSVSGPDAKRLGTILALVGTALLTASTSTLVFALARIRVESPEKPRKKFNWSLIPRSKGNDDEE
jgi:hypothetical protein